MVGIGGAEAAPAAEELKKEAEKHGLDTKDLKIEVDGDKVKVEGDVPDQETKEKLIVAMGTVKGVAQVDESSSSGQRPVCAWARSPPSRASRPTPRCCAPTSSNSSSGSRSRRTPSSTRTSNAHSTGSRPV